MKNKTLILFLLLSACATSPRKQHAMNKTNTNSAINAQSNNNDSADRDMALVLQKKAQMDVQQSNFNSMSEVELLKSLSEARDRQDEVGFRKRYDVFMQRFSKGSLAGDATYLAGLMELSVKNYGKALRSFSLVQKLYPYNHRASSALYFKAVTLKKMNLAKQAAAAYSTVIQKYPGSPEAMHASAELKNINK